MTAFPDAKAGAYNRLEQAEKPGTNEDAESGSQETAEVIALFSDAGIKVVSRPDGILIPTGEVAKVADMVSGGADSGTASPMGKMAPAGMPAQ